MPRSITVAGRVENSEGGRGGGVRTPCDSSSRNKIDLALSLSPQPGEPGVNPSARLRGRGACAGMLRGLQASPGVGQSFGKAAERARPLRTVPKPNPGALPSHEHLPQNAATPLPPRCHQSPPGSCQVLPGPVQVLAGPNPPPGTPNPGIPQLPGFPFPARTRCGIHQAPAGSGK